MAMIIGGTFIVLGLFPRLLAGLQDAIQNFSDSLRSHYSGIKRIMRILRGHWGWQRSAWQRSS